MTPQDHNKLKRLESKLHTNHDTSGLQFSSGTLTMIVLFSVWRNMIFTFGYYLLSGSRNKSTYSSMTKISQKYRKNIANIGFWSVSKYSKNIAKISRKYRKNIAEISQVHFWSFFLKHRISQKYRKNIAKISQNVRIKSAILESSIWARNNYFKNSTT